MLFYQQSAIADKKLAAEHYATARCDTAIGAVVTQLVMAAVLIACAATLSGKGITLHSVGDMSEALTPYLGIGPGRFVFSAGVLGAGMVAAIVCSLGFAWGLGEVTGYRHTLEQQPLRVRWFYGGYLLMIASATAIVALWPDLVALNIGVQVMNALMLPAVLGMLAALAMKALPHPHRPRGPYLWLVVAVCTLTGGTAVLGAIFGIGLLD
jgi:Mn2+/Fe2+ NRAMP family transporter